MNTTNYVIMILVAITCIFGFSTFAVDLGSHYDTDFSSNITDTANDTMGRLENITNEFYNIFSDDNTWEQTTFSIFFTLPGNIIALLIEMPTMASALVHSGMADMGIIVPNWIIPVIGTVLTIIIFMIIVSILFNRSDT